MAAKLETHTGNNWICDHPGTVVCSSASIDVAAIIAAIPGISLLSGDASTCSFNRVTVDSRKVVPGSLFIAISGTTSDGHDFVTQARAAGCAAILVEEGRITQVDIPEDDICILVAANTRWTYAELAAMLFSYPSQVMTMFGVTGTNGKTSVSYLLESVLLGAGKQPGVLGTINYRYFDAEGNCIQLPSAFTTPEPFLLQQTLRLMADSGVDSIVMEISSHGLEQNRIGGITFDVAAFTNLSRDHLDYHLDMESYFCAKKLLFSNHMRPHGWAVVSFSAEERIWSEKLLRYCRQNGVEVLSCGELSRSDIYPLSVVTEQRRTKVRLHTVEGECILESPLIGEFNVANLQTAFAMARCTGIATTIICDALKTATGAPGRMEQVRVARNEISFRPAVFVDYAHTPDALEQVLRSVKQLPHSTLYTVFGCGGDRDAGKRPLMAGIAEKYSDVVVLTSDNPRSEDPDSILRDIERGMSSRQHPVGWLDSKAESETGYVVIPDRNRAITAAILAATGDDIVLVAGKGHENYQLGNNGKKFFDDSLEAAEALCNWNVDSLIRATGGEFIGQCESKQQRVSGAINTDSRTIEAGDIFVALKGDRFDGHQYVSQVVAAGAACLVLEDAPDGAFPIPVLLVKDTEKALGDLAGYRRAVIKEMSSPRVAAVTGSSGKTTVKEMCASIFREQWPDGPDVAQGRVLKTKGNFNNLIGLPLSLLPLSPRHSAAILEMGMNVPGEIARLTAIADPDIACIVNVHGAHLQGLGDIEGVARAKAELFQGCGRGTTLVVNSDDARVLEIAKTCDQKKIFFGLNGGDSAVPEVYSVPKTTSGGEENVEFILHVYEKKAAIVLQVPGRHNISNALAAAAIGVAAGIEIETVARGLMAFRPEDRRMEILSGPGGSRLINDTYNANPESMKAGIATLRDLGNSSRIAVLGDMLELGSESDILHNKIGAYVTECGIDYLAVLGEFASCTASGALKQGMKKERVKIFKEQEECLCWLKEMSGRGEIQSGSYILVKGSRGMHLESLVERFIGEQ